jgi:hypothetical protein
LEPPTTCWPGGTTPQSPPATPRLWFSPYTGRSPGPSARDSLGRYDIASVTRVRFPPSHRPLTQAFGLGSLGRFDPVTVGARCPPTGPAAHPSLQSGSLGRFDPVTVGARWPPTGPAAHPSLRQGPVQGRPRDPALSPPAVQPVSASGGGAGQARYIAQHVAGEFRGHLLAVLGPSPAIRPGPSRATPGTAWNHRAPPAWTRARRQATCRVVIVIRLLSHQDASAAIPAHRTWTGPWPTFRSYQAAADRWRGKTSTTGAPAMAGSLHNRDK